MINGINGLTITLPHPIAVNVMSNMIAAIGLNIIETLNIFLIIEMLLILESPLLRYLAKKN
jgi:hypothetical protein